MNLPSHICECAAFASIMKSISEKIGNIDNNPYILREQVFVVEFFLSLEKDSFHYAKINFVIDFHPYHLVYSFFPKQIEEE
jgi:hypothetical protein